MTTADRIKGIDHPLKAPELARLLNFPLQRIYKMARDCQIPSFRFGTAVRFDPQAVADWLRTTDRVNAIRALPLTRHCLENTENG
jgi:excisionase family DNA binding protein